MANKTENRVSGHAEEMLKSFKEEVHAARELLAFVVSTGRRSEDGRELRDQVITPIRDAEQFLYNAQCPSSEQRLAFDRAYRELALFAAPVTIETLRATSDAHGRTAWGLTWGKPLSEAKIWSRKLWIITTVLVILALAGDILGQFASQFLPAAGETRDWFWVLFVHAPLLALNTLLPFTYGGIGACAYLLRMCHEYIHKREFDPRRIPEYYNRLLLGIVSGGAILLFTNKLIANGGEAIHLSSAAVGFLAGYNTDFLFATVERIIAAILPKVGLESVRRVPLRGVPPTSLLEDLTLRELLDRRDKAATDADRQFYEDLIARLKEHL
ncbi:hypothetical protein Nhal_0154 [Nitrosococcus halophilus Nc 4]|uniref:Uncharacterized protein n=1 Tax=Nitrosococcus halophilus (strain Nc4) TaxID=472759 RepID=D5C4U7_NITHN|nr:hypothetical protein [Nitrosococcus halophilus]ADE13370.1 hypothetical protein Nhal_0154 [Nitrosococcus halophilus Nc 4]